MRDAPASFLKSFFVLAAAIAPGRLAIFAGERPDHVQIARLGVNHRTSSAAGLGAALSCLASMAAAASPPAAGAEPAAIDSSRASRRLSVTNANALANFSVLQSHFRNHRLVVFLDYDGTLTPIVNDPALALLSPAMKDTLEKLREKFITGVI
ncbi:hypothetical protein BBJ28_00003813, partial [Nothophytophthora sp. Chile5]